MSPRVQAPVAESKMAGKRGAAKGKAEESSLSSAEWKKSKCTESTLLQLVEEGLLQSSKVVQWRESGSDASPFENIDELVLF